MPFLKQITCDKEKGENFPYNLPIFKNGFDLELKSNVTIFVGENGSGKSTLLESIAVNCGFNKMGGNRNHVYDIEDDTPLLNLKMSWFPKTNKGFFMRAESFYNFSSYLDKIAREYSESVSYQPYGGKSLHSQSHGEAFLALFKNKFDAKSKSIFILDEPEAALSPQRQLSFLHLISELDKTGQAQFIIATHSPILLAYPKATIFEIVDEKFKEVSFKETQHFSLTKDFLNNPEIYLKHLIE